MNPGPEDDAAGEVVRPFVVTRGRTRPVRPELRLETLVTAVRAAFGAPLDFERLRIVELCRFPRSVAEIAALLSLPLGVARVLVGDLAAEGHVHVHDHPYENAERPSIALLERVRDGLLRL